MILKFKVENGNTYEVDTADLKWRRVSSVLVTTDGTEGALEEGGLIPQGSGVYNLAKIDTKESGGLTTVAVNPIPEGNALTIFLQANVGIKDIEMPQAIDIVRAAIVPGASVEDRQALAKQQTEAMAKFKQSTDVVLGPDAVEPTSTGGVIETGLAPAEQGKDSIGE